ncbi:MAG: RNA polymerase sigma factor [Acidobacteriota bacterium]
MPEPDELTDEELLGAVQRRDPGAFDAFVDRYGRRLMAFGMRMCGKPEDAEDVFQETLLTAYEGLDKLREPAAVRTWLFRVAANACRMQWRKESRRGEISLEEFKPADWDDEFVPQIPDWSDLPEDSAERMELREALEEGFARLPEHYRIVVLLRDVEGLSTKETAEVLDIRTPAVKMRLHRAREALRQHLEEFHVLAREGIGSEA